MGIFDQQIEFINDVEKNIGLVLQETIRRFDFVVKDYVVNKQLFQKGIDGDGERLPGYKRTTIRIKLSKGQPVDRTTLHDTEKFVESITIDTFNDRFEIGSSVSYDKWIVKRYGRNVLKVTEENFREFMNVYFLPNFKSRYGLN